MTIEFEPTRWESRCGRFKVENDIDLQVWAFHADDNKDDEEEIFYTFADAVAWCEARAKQEVTSDV